MVNPYDQEGDTMSIRETKTTVTTYEYGDQGEIVKQTVVETFETSPDPERIPGRGTVVNQHFPEPKAV